MELFDGKYHSKLLEEKISTFLQSSKGRKFLEERHTLAIIQVGENKSSEVYINLKIKLCEKLDLPVEFFKFDSDLPEDVLVKDIKEVLTRSYVKSVIIQLPLPIKIRAKILDLIPTRKDIDLLSSTKQHAFYNSDFSLLPPVARACEYFLSSINAKFDVKSTVIVGGGFLVGKPLAYYLKSSGIAVQVIENYEVGKKLNADLVILSAGLPNLVKGEDLSAKACVIDFGSSMVNGKTVGDLDMQSGLDHLGVISPSPGGMGPLVVRFLIMNHLGI